MNKILKNTLLVLITAAVSSGLTLGVIAISLLEQKPAYDYMIDLRNDSVFITSEYGRTNVIYFEKLEEYLVWDNL